MGNRAEGDGEDAPAEEAEAAPEAPFALGGRRCTLAAEASPIAVVATRLLKRRRWMGMMMMWWWFVQGLRGTRVDVNVT